MKGSIKIIRLFGVPLLLHWSFLLLAPLGWYYGQQLELEQNEMVWWALFGVAVFCCIILHEYGHALVARKYGVKTRDIVLFPIGGMARLDRLPEKPVQEFLVALAGPLVNVLIALVLFPFFWFYTRPALLTQAIPDSDNIDDNFFFFLPLLLFLNLLLALFNLIPAFPMDGGRILRALLSIRFGRLRATKIAVGIGQVLAVGLIFYGMSSERFSYLLIGFFIAYTAMREYRWVKTESLLASYKVDDVFMRQHHPLLLDDDLQKATAIFERTGQKGFLVFDHHTNLVGTLDMGKLLEMDSLPNQQVKDLYEVGFGEISASATLKEANEMMQHVGHGILAVIGENGALGVLEEEMVWKHL